MVQHYSLIDDDEEDIGPRASAPVLAGETLEDQQKTKIHIAYKGQRIPVSWFSDTKAEDIRVAIESACDCVTMENAYDLVELFPKLEYIEAIERYLSGSNTKISDKEMNYFDLGRTISLEDRQLNLTHGWMYQMVPRRNNCKRRVNYNHERFLCVEVNPLLHKEAITALQKMKKGCNLLKVTSHGNPHLRFFQLSNDGRRLLWFSGNKTRPKSRIDIDSIREIILGQNSPNFVENPIPILSPLSFSLLYGENHYLDVTCSDECEYNIWLTGLKALKSFFDGKNVSKKYLLSHISVFANAIEAKESNMYHILEHIFDEYFLSHPPQNAQGNHTRSYRLLDFIDIPKSSVEEIQMRLRFFDERLREIKESVNKIFDEYTTEGGRVLTHQDLEIADVSVFIENLTRANNANNSIGGDANKNKKGEVQKEEDDEDECLEMNQMMWFVSSASSKLRDIKKLLSVYYKREFEEESWSSEGGEKERKGEKRKEKDVASPSLLNLVEEEDEISPVNSHANSRKSSQGRKMWSASKICKKIDEKIWFLDVDLENIDDLISRNNYHQILKMFSRENLTHQVDSSIKSIKNFFNNFWKKNQNSDSHPPSPTSTVSPPRSHLVRNPSQPKKIITLLH